MYPFSDKKILITGGLGFIGSNMAKKLVEIGAQVTLVDNLMPEYGGNIRNIFNFKDKIKVNIADVRDEDSMHYLVRDIDYLFNLAGQTSHQDSMSDPYTDLDINTKAQLSILEACRKNNPEIKIVFASTRQIYGKPLYLPVDEKHPPNPIDVNGINKLAGEQFHILYNNVYGIRSCALRLTNTYGPGMRVKDARQTFIGIWIKNVLTNKPLLVYGSGKQIRDFIYIDDAITALLYAALSPLTEGKALNVGGMEKMDLLTLADLIVKINQSGTSQIVPYPPEEKKIDIGDYYTDDHLFRSLTCWQPTVVLAEGLKRTIEFYKSNSEYYF